MSLPPTTVQVEVGASFFVEGEVWEVVDLSPAGVLLRRDDQLRRMSMALLVDTAQRVGNEGSDETPLSVAWTNLPSTATGLAERRARAVRERVDTGDGSNGLLLDVLEMPESRISCPIRSV